MATDLRRVSTSILLFLFFFSLYVFTMSGEIRYGDEIEKYRVAQSIVERGDFTFRRTAQRNVIGVSGRTVSGYELGQTLVEVPLYVLGKLAYTIFTVPDSNALTMLMVGLLNPLFSALTVVLFFQLGTILSFRLRTALGVALLLGLATILFPYSRSFTREPLLTFLLLLSLFFALRFSQRYAERWLWLTGLSLGYLFFTKFIHGIVIPFFLLYLASAIFQRERQRGSGHAPSWTAVVRGMLIVLLPCLAFLIAQSLYAFARFGNLTRGLSGLPEDPISLILQLLPYGNPPEAMLGLLFSPNKSVFLYSPPLLLAGLGWWRWYRVQPREALFVLILVLVEFLPVILRWDWDGGTWWGPRYLVQITPFLVLPIGFLFTASTSSNGRRWYVPLSGLAGIGFLIQIVGALVNERDHLDVTGRGSTLRGQIHFLSNGVIDSLLISLSPDGLPVRLNPYGILLLTSVMFLGWLIAKRWQSGSEPQSSWRVNGIFLASVLSIQAIGFIIGVVAPYPQIRAAKGDTRFVAANNFLAQGKPCEAIGLYSLALEYGTHFQAQAAAQLTQLVPPAQGTRVPISNPSFWIDGDGEAIFEADASETITGNGSIRFTAPPPHDASIGITSAPLPAAPNTAYELSGWVKSLAIYGTGYGVVSIFEDDGNWGNGRTTDIKAIDETSGWQLFRRTITTLPTTRRLSVKLGLYKTYGTLWVDGIQLIRVDSALPQPQPRLPPCK